MENQAITVITDSNITESRHAGRPPSNMVLKVAGYFLDVNWTFVWAITSFDWTSGEIDQNMSCCWPLLEALCTVS